MNINGLTFEGLEVTITYDRHDLMPFDDAANGQSKRDIYRVTLTRGGRSYSFDYGQATVFCTRLLQRSATDGKVMKEFILPVPPDGTTHALVKLPHSRGGKHCESVLNDYLNHRVSSQTGKPLATLKWGKAPTAEDVFAALLWYDPDTFEDFCASYGYDTDSRRAYQTWEAVTKEYQALERLFSEPEMEAIREAV